jgi:superfamily II DNA or RNA helicase
MIPRPYQQAALDAISSALKVHQTVGVVMPTGSGKSLVESMLIDRACDELSFNECVIVVCHISDVVDQLHLFYCTHGRYAKHAMKFTRTQKPRMPHKVVFATIQQLMTPASKSYWTTDPLRKEVRVVLLDEAHSLGSDSSRIMNNEIFPLARLVGFSATPYRNNLFSFSQFDHVAFAIDTHTLIAAGFLCPPKLFELEIGEMSPGERFAHVIKIWEEREKPRKLVSVVYLRSTAEAQEMRLVAEEHGIRSEYVDGQSSDIHTRDVYIRARRGEVEMIVNCRKLETGIDIPNIGSVFMPWGTNSVVSYLQRIGRALRPFAGKDAAHVYVLGDAPSIASGKWKRLQRDALRADRPLEPIEQLVDDLEDLEDKDTNPARIAWTREAIAAVTLLKGLNMRGVEELIAERKFPEKYSKAIAKLSPFIAQHARKDAHDSPILEAQISLLSERYQFSGSHCQSLTKNEAQAILEALKGYYSRSPFILQTGPHAGKHISDTPPMYRKMMKEPGNRVLWQRWIKAGRPAE